MIRSVSIRRFSKKYPQHMLLLKSGRLTKLISLSRYRNFEEILIHSENQLRLSKYFLLGVAVDDAVLLQNEKFHQICPILVSKCSARSNQENEYPHFMFLAI